ncbi:ferritin [Treponema sp. OMZ 840]|uniref:ferritin n=1 Tax=Treponema sp. OMZ 840 TaxID=244313 RepID=UPI003D8D7599
MLDKKVSRLLNEQINKELFSAYVYLDISNYFYDEGLEGFGNWYKIQAKEEQDHADLILQYLQNNGEKIILEAIDKPNHSYKEFKDALVVSLHHEQYVTSLIHTIYAAAIEVKDYRTMQFLDWFVKEQGEEEKNTEDMIKKYDLFGSDAKALYMLDSELKARTYAPPSLVL